MFKFISCCGSGLINNDNLWLHTFFAGCLPREAKARYEHLRLVNLACVWCVGVWGGGELCVCGGCGWVVCVCVCVCAYVWMHDWMRGVERKKD